VLNDEKPGIKVSAVPASGVRHEGTRSSLHGGHAGESLAPSLNMARPGRSARVGPRGRTGVPGSIQPSLLNSRPAAYLERGSPKTVGRSRAVSSIRRSVPGRQPLFSPHIQRVARAFVPIVELCGR
jgi:hypothetical protein